MFSVNNPQGRIMATLSTKARKQLPASTFAGPDRSYPIPDKSHAANAKARASQAANAGRMSLEQKAMIDSKANTVLGKRKAAAPKMNQKMDNMLDKREAAGTLTKRQSLMDAAYDKRESKGK